MEEFCLFNDQPMETGLWLPAYDVTWCEGPGGYHQMDVLGEALDIERKHLQSLGVQEAELSADPM